MDIGAESKLFFRPSSEVITKVVDESPKSSKVMDGTAVRDASEILRFPMKETGEYCM